MINQIKSFFKNIYINGILANKEDKERFINDYQNQNIFIKSILVNEQLDYCIIETI